MFWNKGTVGSAYNKRSLLKMFHLPDTVESLLLERMVERSVNSGDVVVREGDQGNSLFFIASGSLMVQKRNAEGQAVVLSRMNPGDFFGEISVFRKKRRSSTVIAVEDSVLFEIELKASIVFLISKTPEFMDALKAACLRRIENDKLKIGKSSTDDDIEHS